MSFLDLDFGGILFLCFFSPPFLGLSVFRWLISGLLGTFFFFSLFLCGRSGVWGVFRIDGTVLNVNGNMNIRYLYMTVHKLGSWYKRYIIVIYMYSPDLIVIAS